MYLLDTDVVSNFRKRTPNPNLMAWIAGIPADEIAIPLAAVFDIQMGIETLRVLGKTEQADETEAWLENILQTKGSALIAPNVAVVRLQARMFSTPKLKNFPWPQPNASKIKTGTDLIIAATAIVHGATVVTFNVDDFMQIHVLFALPGLFHPGRREWLVEPNGGTPPPPAFEQQT